MKSYKILFAIVSFFCVLQTSNAIRIDESQATATIFKTADAEKKQYTSTVEFYESNDFIESKETLTSLEYSIKLPAGILLEEVTYEVEKGYKVTNKAAFNHEYNGNQYGILILNIEKDNLKEGESILQNEIKKVLTLIITTNKKGLCSSKPIVNLEKSISDDKKTLKIDAYIQKNVYELEQDFIIGYDNKNGKLSGIYYDKNSEYINLPIKILKDNCSKYTLDDFSGFETIDALVNVGGYLTIDSLTNMNENISEITADKEAGTFFIEYNNNQEAKKQIYENKSGVNIKLKRKDVTKPQIEIINISITSQKINSIDYGGGAFEIMLLPGTLGDWNLDEKTDIKDIISARKFVVSSKNNDLILNGLEDTNDDGKVSILDIIWLRKTVSYS